MRKRRHEKVKCFFLSHLARKGQSSGRYQSPSLEVVKPPSGVCCVRDVTVVRGCGGILAPSWRKLCTRAEEGKPYYAFRLRRILPEEGMTHEWVAGASWGPWGICLRESSLLSGTVWLCCFKSLLWALLEEITPLGQRGSGRCCQWGVA